MNDHPCKLSVTRFSSFIFLAIVFAITQGCAATSFGRKMDVVLEQGGTSSDDQIEAIAGNRRPTIGLSTNCKHLHVFSVMLSPIVPLPPIVPLWFLTETPKLRVCLGFWDDKLKVPDSAVSLLTEKERLTGTRGEITNSKCAREFEFPIECKRLDLGTLEFEGLTYEGIPLRIEPVKVHVNRRYYLDVDYVGRQP